MTNKNISQLIPNISKLPSQKKAINKNLLKEGETSEFKKVLDGEAQRSEASHGIKLSVHAAKRLNERDIHIDNEEFFKLKNGINKLQEKGGRDSLVITGKGAYIVDVPNNKIVTAIDKESISENVFTKIDSTIIM